MLFVHYCRVLGLHSVKKSLQWNLQWGMFFVAFPINQLHLTESSIAWNSSESCCETRLSDPGVCLGYQAAPASKVCPASRGISLFLLSKCELTFTFSWKPLTVLLLITHFLHKFFPKLSDYWGWSICASILSNDISGFIWLLFVLSPGRGFVVLNSFFNFLTYLT